MNENTFAIDPSKTALVLIDLQRGITYRDVAPRSGAEVVANAVKLTERFHELNATVVLVRVSFAGDGADRVHRPIDAPLPQGTPPDGWDQIVPELGPKSGDIVVTKRQWGAFYGTDLDLHLRRRGIETLVLGGIATSIGVESTARDAFERNYGLIAVEDAMADMSADAHAFTISHIFPRISRVRSTAQVIAAI
ncbi:MAG: hydrolase [Capsulimonadaceae bacterium]|nr:hydrolase [Capsulimonadaceae bacterium]